MDRTTITFWTLAWVGTTIAGGVFGLVFGCVVGLIIGSMIAGIYAIPIHATVAILTWAFWLARFRVLTAAFAGGVTGVLTTWLIFDAGIFGSELWITATLAALCGSFGTGTVCYWHWKATKSEAKIVDGLDDSPWQFGLKDLFIRFTVVACLLAGWIWLIALVNPFSPTAWEPWRELALPSDAVIENHLVNEPSFDVAAAFSIRYESETAIDVVIDAYDLRPCVPNSHELTSYVALGPPPWWNVSHITETYARTDQESETYASLWVDREAKLLYVEIGGW